MLCIATASCGGLPASACGVCVLKFLPSVVFSENPYEFRVPRLSIQPRSGSDFNRLLRERFAEVRNLIGLVGFEPTASCTRGRRSTKLSHSPNTQRSRLRKTASISRAIPCVWQECLGFSHSFLLITNLGPCAFTDRTLYRNLSPRIEKHSRYSSHF
jgi:hypothetical protein